MAFLSIAMLSADPSAHLFDLSWATFARHLWGSELASRQEPRAPRGGGHHITFLTLASTQNTRCGSTLSIGALMSSYELNHKVEQPVQNTYAERARKLRIQDTTSTYKKPTHTFAAKTTKAVPIKSHLTRTLMPWFTWCCRVFSRWLRYPQLPPAAGWAPEASPKQPPCTPAHERPSSRQAAPRGV